MIFVNNDAVMGRNIRCLRQRHALSLQEFARRMNMDPSELHAIETGSLMQIDALCLQKISCFFHIPVQTLVEKKLNFLLCRGDS